MIASHWKQGWYCCPGNPTAAKQHVDSMRLLSEKELRLLFPEARIYKERFAGLAKSLIAYHGWCPASENSKP